MMPRQPDELQFSEESTVASDLDDTETAYCNFTLHTDPSWCQFRQRKLGDERCGSRWFPLTSPASLMTGFFIAQTGQPLEQSDDSTKECNRNVCVF